MLTLEESAYSKRGVIFLNLQEASPVLGVPVPFKWLSASQISTYIDCKRKWGWRYLTGYKDPAAASAQVGSRVHELLEDYLRTAKPPNYKETLKLLNSRGTEKVYEPGRIAEAFLPFLPAPGPHLDVEEEFWHEYYYGKVDVAYLAEAGIPVVMDHKTSSNIKLYAKTEQDLLGDPQAMIYADVAMERTGSKEAYLVWNYGSTSTPYKVKRVALKVLREHSRAVLDSLAPTAEEMQVLYKIKAYEEQTQPLETLHQTLTDMVLKLPPSMESCGKYGGCPNLSRCAFTSEQSMKAAFAQKGSHSMAEQSLLESFKEKIKAAAAHSAAGVGHLPAPVLPPGPSLPVGLPDDILRALPPVHEPKMPAEMTMPVMPSAPQAPLTHPGFPAGFPMAPQVALASTASPPGLPPGFPVSPQVALAAPPGLPPGFPVPPQVTLAAPPGLPTGFPMAPQVALAPTAVPSGPSGIAAEPAAPGLPHGFPMAPQVALAAPSEPASSYTTVPPLPPQAAVSVTVPLAPMSTAEYIQSLNAPEAPKTELAEPGVDDEADTSDLGATYKHLPKEALVAIAKRNGIDLGKSKEPGIRKKLGAALGPFANHLLVESTATETTAPAVIPPTVPNIPLESLAPLTPPMVPNLPLELLSPSVAHVAPSAPVIVTASLVPMPVAPQAPVAPVAPVPPAPPSPPSPPAPPAPVAPAPPLAPPAPVAPVPPAPPAPVATTAAPTAPASLTLADMQNAVEVLEFVGRHPVSRKEGLKALFSLCEKLLQLPE